MDPLKPELKTYASCRNEFIDMTLQRDDATIPLLSIWVVTYNHGKYIGECLKSALMQKTTFDYEIIVGEDCSIDNTKDIIKEYAKAFPEKIKPIYHNVNVGVFENAFLHCLPKMRGKYVACLEGDDYWTDSKKLQKQVDFLESNKDYSICAHEVQIEENGSIRKSEHSELDNQGFDLTIHDLAKGNILSSPSVVFRNGLIKEFPAWLKDSPASDYVLHMLNAKQGKIKVLPENMAVYRRHSGGIWSSTSKEKMLNNWITVLTYLLQEDFDSDVVVILKAQRRKHATNYLQLILGLDLQVFLAELKRLTEDDPELGTQWLFQHFPSYINELHKSNTFKLAKSIAKTAALMKTINPFSAKRG